MRPHRHATLLVAVPLLLLAHAAPASAAPATLDTRHARGWGDVLDGRRGRTSFCAEQVAGSRFGSCVIVWSIDALGTYDGDICDVSAHTSDEPIAWANYKSLTSGDVIGFPLYGAGAPGEGLLVGVSPNPLAETGGHTDVSVYDVQIDAGDACAATRLVAGSVHGAPDAPAVTGMFAASANVWML